MPDRSARPGAFSLFTLAFLLYGPATAVAQTGSDDRPRMLTPMAALGTSTFIADIWEDAGASTGAAVRGGIRFPYVDVTALVEHWGNVRGFRISSVHLETSYFVAGQRTLAPLLLVGIGYARSRHRNESTLAEEIDGISAALGVGLHLAAWDAIGLRTEGLLRTDDGGYNGAVRILLGWGSDPPHLPTHLPETRTDLGAYWMVPLSGPWRFVEPGYIVRFVRPFQDHLSGSLALGVFHWQIPGQALLRNYIWDTRAFTAMPGVEWHPGGQRMFSVRAGPSIILMGEGPGNGVSGGTHMETAVSRPWSLPVSAGVGWLWMHNDGGGDSRVSPADQIGLMLFGGLHF